jgi:hypothetical protein
LKLFKSKQIRNSKLSNRKEIEKRKIGKKGEKAWGTVSAEPGKQPTAHPASSLPNRYANPPYADMRALHVRLSFNLGPEPRRSTTPSTAVHRVALKP